MPRETPSGGLCYEETVENTGVLRELRVGRNLSIHLSDHPPQQEGGKASPGLRGRN